jgi:hypothetical protein
MDRNRFNAEVRPLLTEIPIGRQGVAFDGQYCRGEAPTLPQQAPGRATHPSRQTSDDEEHLNHNIGSTTSTEKADGNFCEGRPCFMLAIFAATMARWLLGPNRGAAPYWIILPVKRSRPCQNSQSGLRHHSPS